MAKRVKVAWLFHTEKTVAFTETTESLLAGAFVRILTVEVKQIHCVSFQLFYMECLQILFLCLHWHLRACLNFANLDVCGHSFKIIYTRNCVPLNGHDWDPLLYGVLR